MSPQRRAKFIVIIVAALVVAAGLAGARVALAQTSSPLQATELLPNQIGAELGTPAVDLRLVIARIIRAALGLLGVVALALVLYAGFIWMTAGGNEEKIAEAKKFLVNAVIGLVIILSAFAIVSFVISKLVEATTGGGGQNQGGGGPGGANFSNLFYISSLPPATFCVRNPHPAVVFNREVDIKTLTGNAIVTDDKGVAVSGGWQAGTKPTTAIFVPFGACAPDAGSDCLSASSTYRLTFNNPSRIKNLDGSLTLNCLVSSCGPVNFVTGGGVDRQSPTITISYPTGASLLKAGDTIPVQMNFTDDFGVQNISLYSSPGSNFQGVGGFRLGASFSVPQGYNMRAADFNNDGKPDLAVSVTSTLQMFFGNGDGSFRLASVTPLAFPPTYITGGDFNNDGQADLAVTRDFGGSAIAVLLGRGDGGFQAPILYQVTSAATYILATDVNGDKKTDLLVTRYYNNDKISVLLGSGDGTFQSEKVLTVATNMGGFQVDDFITVADFNSDGKADLAIAREPSSTIAVTLGNGDGTFKAPTQFAVNVPGFSYGNPAAIAAHDFNGDGQVDLAVTHWMSGKADSVSIWFGQGDGTFAKPVFYPAGVDPKSLILGDFNSDGKTDLAVGLYQHLSAPAVQIFFGQGNGAFQPPILFKFPPTGSLFSLVGADWNGDGVMDFAGLGYTNSVSLVTSLIADSQKIRAGTLVGSLALQGCQKTGSATINWPTQTLAPGPYTLEANALDLAAQLGVDVKVVTLKPAHCFDDRLDKDLGELEAGPPACGGECGVCGGASCRSDQDCASGFCEIVPPATTGICVDKMAINSVAPLSGAPGSYLTLSGFWFGENPGAVFFSNTTSPDVNNPAHWAPAKLVACAVPFDNWTSWQILVEAPSSSLAKSPIKVVTGNIAGKDGKTRVFTDVTNDAWGPTIPDFVFTNLIRPSLCAVVPDSQPAGGAVSLFGKNLGTLDKPNVNKALFGDTAGTVNYFISQGPNKGGLNWTDSLINEAVVPALAPGVVGVRVINASGVESNSVRFTIDAGVSLDSPIIFSITPSFGAPGEYITITGKNFGADPGGVLFAASRNDNVPVPGDFEFPAACGAAWWRPDQIIVKFNKNLGRPNTAYLVRVRTAEAKLSPFDDNAKFTLTSGQPAPGICKLDPVSGPVPFAPGQTAQLVGEYFTSAPVVKADLILHYSFDGASINGVTVEDESGAGHNGELKNGVAVVPGQSGSTALQFDGQDDYVEVPAFGGNDLSEFSAAIWFTNTRTDGVLFSQQSGGCGSFTIYSNAKTSGQICFTDDTNTAANSNINTADGKWHHGVTVSDGLTVKLYLDGALVATSLARIAPGRVSLSVNNSLGRYLDNKLYLTGRIDDVRLYSRALSSQEAADLYTAGANSQGATGVYFWKNNASPTTTIGRLAADANDSFSITTLAGADVAKARPPLGAESGPVVVYRSLDKKISNPLNFSVLDCVKNNNSCTLPNYTCCTAGRESGFCKPPGELCAGSTRSAAYVWRFSTADIPAVPRVVERCNAATEQGLALPTPSPSVLWDASLPNPDQGDHHNVCRSAVIDIELSTLMDQATVNGASVIVNRCLNVDGNNCTQADVNSPDKGVVALDPASFTLRSSFGGQGNSRQYLELRQLGGAPWSDRFWYQVVLNKNIRSAGSVTTSLPLAIDRPCGNNSAYCFVFKTDSQSCKMRAVVIAPYDFWTDVLEAPIKQRALGVAPADLLYNGNGLSSQRCIMMDVAGFSWSWNASNTFYANVQDASTTATGTVFGRRARAQAIANTVAIGLANPDDAVNINAIAATSGVNYVGHSPLTIDLSHPEVKNFWPACQEACTNAAVGAEFTVTMSDVNVNWQTVRLFHCLDDNCRSLQPITTTTLPSFDQSLRRTITIPHDDLLPSASYLVRLSSANAPALQLWSAGNLFNPTATSAPYKKEFNWRFKTKKDKCLIDHVKVSPDQFNAATVNDKAIYYVQPFSAPDACSASGQKLDPWAVSWGWSSSDQNVASTTAFNTNGRSPYCTAGCTKKGSDVPSTVTQYIPVCGNSVVEAGEDCDMPSVANGCGLDCRFLGKSAGSVCGNGKVELGEACDPKDATTTIGCSADCRHLGSNAVINSQDINASVCGNGSLGSGEDCDLGIDPSPTSTVSALGCSAICLHLGTRLGSAWCANPLKTQPSGFVTSSIISACRQAYSQCGDNETSPDEDVGCDLGNGAHSAWCNDRCLIDNVSHKKCVPDSEGCNSAGQYVGSSLLYSRPSVCGDGSAGLGEDPTCEQNLRLTHVGLIDPWALATGIGRGIPTGTPPAQIADITAATNQQTKGGLIQGSGKFVIACGFKTDADCEQVYGEGFGVGYNSCCYARPKLIGTFPASSTPPAGNICPNTYLSATFDMPLDPATVLGNVIIARGNTGAPAPTCAGDNDVTNLIVQASPTHWYQRWWIKLAGWLEALMGSPARAIIIVNQWCKAGNLAGAEVLASPATTTVRLVLRLNTPLATSTDYSIILKPELRSDKGVRIGTSTPFGKVYDWQFSTGPEICRVKLVTVKPDKYLFSRAGATTTLEAEARTDNRVKIQAIPGAYDWQYLWAPPDNPYVTLTNTTTNFNLVTAQNRNGELDVAASANITADQFNGTTGVAATGLSHLTVFLCANPWPPKVAFYNGQGPFQAFPYTDGLGNTSGNSATGSFDNSAIPPSQFAVQPADGYFNFKTFYCADQGGAGTGDDLPLLRPAVQTSAAVLVAPNFGSCQYSGVSCKIDDDCGRLFDTENGSFILPINGAAVCGQITTTPKKSPLYYFSSSGQPIQCDQNNGLADCNARKEFKDWTASVAFGKPSCIALTVAPKALQCFKYPPLKRFLFTNDQNDDVVGIQVFPNPQHLTPLQWYQNGKSAGGQEFPGSPQTIPQGVDGNAAVSDGNNVYVEALNFTSSTVNKQVTGNLYSNIYLFSININGDVSPDTRAVFEALLKNTTFNSNLTNYGYCGASLAAPDFQIKCVSNLDCPAPQVCSRQIDKLKRDYQRLRDFKEIDSALEQYAQINNGQYPSLKSGTFLTGQTISTWPSWSALGSALGAAASTDPINQLGPAGTCASTTVKFCLTDANCPLKLNSTSTETCLLHDKTTGWSTENRRFSFACASTSLAYRYLYTTSTGYQLRSRFEDPGLPISGPSLNKFISAFDYASSSRFGLPGVWTSGDICLKSEEISTLNTGVCGDGIINWNKGEQCDPPGLLRYGACGGGQISVDHCTKPDEVQPGDLGCQWTANAPIACSALSKCGNGVVEAGETCDDGALNGTYNHCDKPGQVGPNSLGCQKFGSTGYCGDQLFQNKNELCDPSKDLADLGKTGWCIGGANFTAPCDNDNDCDSQIAGVCKAYTDTNVKYALAKSDSCAVTCQARGPYCGDGTVQTEYGEECDGNAQCSVDNQVGVRACSATCHFTDSAAVGWWRFDDVYGQPPPQGQLLQKTGAGQSLVWAGWKNTLRTLVGRLWQPAPALAIEPVAIKYPDSSPQHNDGSFIGSPAPVFKLNGGQVGSALEFSDNTFVEVPGSNSLMPTTSLSVEAWVNPSDYDSAWMRVLEKGGYSKGRGYGMQFYENEGRPEFIVFRTGWNTHLRVDSSFIATTSQWTHIVGTYYFNTSTKNQTIRLYINGAEDKKANVIIHDDNSGDTLQNSNTVNDAVGWLAPSNEPLYISRSSWGQEFFHGLLDEVKIYNRALSPAEVKEHFSQARPCVISASAAIALAPAGSCGDGVVDAKTEACDNGNKNGLACAPSYGKHCSFCAADCKNVVDVQPAEFCGNGIIEGPEFCETVPGTPDIYSNTSSPANATDPNKDINHNGYLVYACADELNQPVDAFRKGAKVCANQCRTLDTSGCITCGNNPAQGVSIAGNIINVLDPSSADPLYADRNKYNFESGNLNLFYEIYDKNGNYQGPQVIATDQNPSLTYTLTSQLKPNTPIMLGSNPVCSTGTPRYRMTINGDFNFYTNFDLPIFGQPNPWQYDLLISPIISAPGLKDDKNNGPLAGSVRPNDIRIVVSWVRNGEFNSGIVVPGHPRSPYEDGGLLGVLGEGFSQGFQYFNNNSAEGIWYHGFGQTPGKSNELAFTIDTSVMSAPRYLFYVRTSDNSPISNFRSSVNLKIDVYVPENSIITNFNRFSRPTRTFYLSAAAPSDNPKATYWQVFNLANANSGLPPAERIQSIFTTDPGTGAVTTYNDGWIVTGVEQMK